MQPLPRLSKTVFFTDIYSVALSVYVYQILSNSDHIWIVKITSKHIIYRRPCTQMTVFNYKLDCSSSLHIFSPAKTLYEMRIHVSQVC